MHLLFAREFEIPAFVPDLRKLEVLLVNDRQQKLSRRQSVREPQWLSSFP